MDTFVPSWLMVAIWVVAALVCWAALVSLGMLSPRDFEGSPQRRVRLPWEVVAIILIINALPLLLWSMQSHSGSPPPVDTTHDSQPSYLVGMLVDILIIKLPVLTLLGILLAGQHRGLHRFGLIPRNPWRETGLGLLAILLAFITITALGSLIARISHDLGNPLPAIGHELLKSMQKADQRFTLWLMIANATLIAPIYEELIYRGLIQTALVNVLGRDRRWLVIILASLIFAAVHAPVIPARLLVLLFLLGAIMGWLYEKTGSLWPPILVHALFNTYNTVIALNPHWLQSLAQWLETLTTETTP